jgi:glycosyltransferase involved in cell wall biosynthesis
VEKKISIITPVFNGEKYLENTIKSVINQNYKNIEYIIVDGGSTDRSREIIEQYKNKISKIIFQKDNSMYEAIKKGFELATGDFFYWINSDDFFLDNNSVDRLMRIINKKNYNWVICKVAISKFNNKPKIYIPLIYPQWILKNGFANDCFWGFVQQENTVFSKELYLESKGINTKFKIMGDYDLWRRFAYFEKLVPLNIKYACHRKNNKQLSKNKKKSYEEIGKKPCIFSFFYPLRFIVSIIYFLFLKK